jgi:hypothetical protein
VQEVLVPSEETTDILGRENYVTGLYVSVVFHNIIKGLEPKVNESRFILDVKKAIKS